MKSLLAISALAWATVASGTTLRGRATAYDGDTLALSFRLFGIDAVERRQLCQDRRGACYECGKAAHRYLRHLLSSDRNGPSKIVTIVLKPGLTYGRQVAAVSVEGRDVGLLMLRAGFAVAEPNYMTADPARRSQYIAAQSEARSAQRGIFQGLWISPKDWRNGRRLSCERRKQSPAWPRTGR